MSLYKRTIEENKLLKLGGSRIDKANCHAAVADKFKQSDQQYQIDWFNKRARIFWNYVTSITDPAGSRGVLDALILRDVDKKSSKLPEYLLDNSTALQKLVSLRHGKYVDSIQKSEKHQAKSLMATLNTRMGETKTAMFSQLLFTTSKDKVVSDEEFAETACRFKQICVAESTDVAGLGTIKVDKRLMSKHYHKQILQKIKCNGFTNWYDERYEQPTLMDSSWLCAPVNGDAIGLPSPDYEVGMCPLEGAIENEIQMYLEQPDISKHLDWVYAEQDSPKQYHFLFL